MQAYQQEMKNYALELPTITFATSHVHEARAYLGVLMAGPRLATLTSPPIVPDQVTAFGQSHAPSPARIHQRDTSIEPARDDWPFLYLRERSLPRHYGITLLLILFVSTVVVMEMPGLLAVLRQPHLTNLESNR